MVAALLAVLVLLFGVGTTSEKLSYFSYGKDLSYTVVAHSPRLNREVQGEVTVSVQGVPAEPVDSFVWDGEGSTPIRGFAAYRIDPVENKGRIVAKWWDRNGAWTLKQDVFMPPDHPSGVRMGPGLGDTTFVEGDPVPVDVYLHGNTGAGGPVLPTIFNMLATWGPAKVTLNGEPFENPFDGPTPQWVAHTMTTVGVRDENGQVHTADGEGIFSAADPADGSVDYDDLEYHIVFHDVPGPGTVNFPPPFQFFYHLTFEDVKVSISQGD
jgi:hypothetical protein